ncbi:MAG: FAD-dependent oxidoreductase [Desulfosalsimonas sp.]|uniref:FAD-dependent oxidoreductase n=1 Tax=Desulfosalsimonas sp. TaxID=3073848 RepID=UPI003970D320
MTQAIAPQISAGPRIGFYICHCGINIAYKVRVQEVAAWMATQANVVISRDYKFMCSDPGQEMIETDIRDYGLNRVVVASCSPRLHEKTFQAVCGKAGINPYLFQMASVREQVSWVTADEDEATQKAKTLAAAAVNRVRFHRPLQTREVGVHPDTLVVGGGIAGMQAALDIAAGGKKVYLVEKDTTIGGHMLQFDKTFPTLDCAACIGTPKMVDVGQHPNIELLSYSEVESVSGYIGNYTVNVRKHPRYVREDACTGCGQCAENCPVTMASGWDAGIGTRKAIYRSFPQSVPITFCIDKKDRAPCVSACPAHANVQGYVQLIGQGKYEEALRLIMEKIPLPGVLGRVCPHPCETRCRRQEIDASVSIRELKRFVADAVDLDSLPLPEITLRQEKVAVIGSGPAGLTAAWDLARAGYQVTIFEAMEQLGGMLRYGIPDYRLPPGVLDREIAYLLKIGITAKTGQRLGREITLKSLEDEGFSAIFIGIGASGGKIPGISGQDAMGVTDAVVFLRRVNAGDTTPPGSQVAVIGGGNVAVDTARAALRLGADCVTIVYRRDRGEMPAFAEEITEAEKEGIRLEVHAAPKGIITEGGNVSGLECIRTRPGPPDEGGRRRPEPIAGSGFSISCDAVISAIGQQVLPDWEDAGISLECDAGSRIIINPQTMQTCIPHVFAAGDAVTGPATAVEAIAAGHRAADSIRQYIEDPESLSGNTTPEQAPEPEPGDWMPLPENIEPCARATATELALQDRACGFDEVCTGLSAEQAVYEARRCLNCGGCCECMECVKACEANAIDHTMMPEEKEIRAGSIILTTGYDLLDPTSMHQYGYGRYPNVFTSLEFERLSNATGPTGGRIMMRDENWEFSKPPESVALLHCIGSRDANYHEYCSRVCCMYALKYSHLIKEKVGHHAQVYEFYIDMRCFGKNYEEFYKRCQQEGTVFIRGKVAEITDEPQSPEEEGKLVAIGEDTLLGRPVRVPVDMAVLCVAMEARPEAAEVGRIFGISQGADGFFLESHPKLGPMETPTDGVFVAGACQSPKDIPDTVAQASGAAAKSLALTSRGRVTISSMISHIDPDICIGCQTCIDLCPYGAIEFDARRGVSVVNEALCKGCGSCSGFCPSGAARVRHFQKKQILAEFDGLMDAIAEVGV